jgi:uncharacterized protein (DUF1697 family)
MADLRALLQGLGCSDVATLLNSGNAVFRAARASSSKHAAAIAAAITGQLHVDVPVIVKSAAEFAAIVEENPFAATAADHSRLLVAFTQEAKALAGLAAVGTLAARPDKFAVGRSAAYLSCPNGVLQSKAGEALLGKPGKLATTRNWATTLKLQALLGELDA